MIEDKKHLLDYLAQIMLIFGITILALTFICYVVGEDAKEYSTMFALGSRGIPLSTILQYLLSSACITGFRFLFFTDTVLKKMTLAKRSIAMVLSVIILIGAFAYIFGWFPVDEAKCWIIFLICFGISFVTSTGVSLWKEAVDNKQLEDGLKHLKEGENDNFDRRK